MGKEYTKNHIVPVAYLKRFGFDLNGKRLIGIRYKDNKGIKLFSDNVNDVGFIKNYYDTAFKDDPKFWEHFFNKEFDTLCGKDLETIISVINLSNDNTVVLNNKSKDILSRIIISQIFRVPSSVNRIFDINAEIENEYKEEYEFLRSSHPNEKIYNVLYELKLTEKQLKEIFFNSFFSKEQFERFVTVLKKGIWIVYYNADNKTTPFVTSDNPVLVEGIGREKSGIYNNPLANPDTCIFFPITPAIAVAIYAKDGFASISRNHFDGKKIVLRDLKYVIKRNVNIMEQAYQHSFIPQPLFDNINNK